MNISLSDSEAQTMLGTLVAVKNGDFSVRLPDNWSDINGKMADNLNHIFDQLRLLRQEVEQINISVGRNGKISQRITTNIGQGDWSTITNMINELIINMALPISETTRVIGAVSKGDLLQSVALELEGRKLEGEFLRTATVVNAMIEQLDTFTSEVTRVAKEVGTEGKLGGQAKAEGLSGSWKILADSVNLMASNLTGQVRNISEVTIAVAEGNLSKKITVDVRGEFLLLKDVINGMVEQLRSFASEVTRVAREVGTEGKLGGQASVPGVVGTWKDLTDNVNNMASNLTAQVRNIAEVTTAVANGDLNKKITVDVKGEVLQLKDTINIMVDQLSIFASEVTRVAREVGTEGKLGGQAEVMGVSGTWKDLTDNVNLLAGNLTAQVRNIAEVTTAVAKGDLNKKITVDVKGEVLQLKDTINIMVDQLSTFASEVTRVAREVGTEGKLGGQAEVRGVSGTWKDLTDNVNLLAGNLTTQVRNIAEVTTAVAKGDLNKKITVDVKGEVLELKDTINIMVDQLSIFASEVTRVAREVGTEGKLGGQAEVRGVSGTWKDLTDNVNLLAGNLTSQVRNIALVTTAVAKGDLNKKITVDVKGEVLELKDTINIMVDQLSIFASEVTRVAREVGTEGKLGGQAEVRGVSGTWKDLTDNVNVLAGNLTSQVRNIALVTTAVANGDLNKKITVDVKGEVLELKDTINIMVDQLSTFASEVTRVAREVGTDGKLGGQANVKGASGTWKDLTDNVNLLAENLTTQVRAIANVATAVTKGDLSKTVQVEAKGEVEELKNNINEMIRNLKDTTRKNTEQDWLKTNLAKFTRMLQGQREIQALAQLLLSEIAPVVKIHHGVFYVAEQTEKKPIRMKLLGSYAYKERKNISKYFDLGEGLVGQCAFEKERILLTNVPSDYIQISSGLGEANPLNIIVLPILFEGAVKGVIELASFEQFDVIQQSFLDQLVDGLGIVLNSIEANSRTEELLKKSQSMTEELGSQQEELKKSNEELEEKAKLLEAQKVEVEKKNEEINKARAELEGKANQLAITSKYKSEFLSNMSHELRTPLNSILLLAHLLSENKSKVLRAKEVEFAKNIHNSGSDLLNLINEILDLTKVESGKVDLEIDAIETNALISNLKAMFGELAKKKTIQFKIVPPAAKEKYMLRSDNKRLEQILKNLLSNAFKFTNNGGKVELNISVAPPPDTLQNEKLRALHQVIAFAVSDTGIGIPFDKQTLVFEAFQQADGSTKRQYGGTGLGLSISRELSNLLGGEIHLQSEVGSGSVFTLYLPLEYEASHVVHSDKKAEVTIIETKKTKPVTETKPNSDLTKDITDDRYFILDNDKVILIIEYDTIFADMLLRFVRERGFKGIVAYMGNTGLSLARHYNPDAIILNMELPIMEGNEVLKHLKNSSDLRHIPVQVISANNRKQEAIDLGAFNFIKKPVTTNDLKTCFTRIEGFLNKRLKQLLIVEDDKKQNKAISELMGNGDLKVSPAFSGKEALIIMKKEPFDCIIVDLGLPDMSGFELLEKMKENDALKKIPVIVYTARDLNKKENDRLKKLSAAVVLKTAHSYERLLNEVVLFLHRIESELPKEKQQIIKKLYRTDEILKNKKVLLVDDDIRNIFSLTNSLEEEGIKCITAENGEVAIQTLKEQPDIDIVLMDVMMPVMDGYEATQAIRKMSQFAKLPIIALTAKAMKGDMEKCLEAGMSDYISKPVDITQLVSLMRAWLYR